MVVYGKEFFFGGGMGIEFCNPVSKIVCAILFLPVCIGWYYNGWPHKVEELSCDIIIICVGRYYNGPAPQGRGVVL